MGYWYKRWRPPATAYPSKTIRPWKFTSSLAPTWLILTWEGEVGEHKERHFRFVFLFDVCCQLKAIELLPKCWDMEGGGNLTSKLRKRNRTLSPLTSPWLDIGAIKQEQQQQQQQQQPWQQHWSEQGRRRAVVVGIVFGFKAKPFFSKGGRKKYHNFKQKWIQKGSNFWQGWSHFSQTFYSACVYFCT